MQVSRLISCLTYSPKLLPLDDRNVLIPRLVLAVSIVLPLASRTVVLVIRILFSRTNARRRLINATAMYQANGKRWQDFWINANTQEAVSQIAEIDRDRREDSKKPMTIVEF